ncbi:uncharacterized protein LOC127281966 [Leptopilina boulardi]|uniref:uncharacterized protein LOC127281966 n=1 Tax=Leptopilina boulardi TaxID=63433 RepID=UPI0021F57E17|nr:uncharacterized protein LOC127281966 [Leptopilina boulardi]
MKSLRELLLFLFILIQLNTFCLSRSTNNQNSEEEKLDQFLKGIVELPSHHYNVKRAAKSYPINSLYKVDLSKSLSDLAGVLAETPYQLSSERRRKRLLVIMENLDELESKFYQLHFLTDEEIPLIEVDEAAYNFCISTKKPKTFKLRKCMLKILKIKRNKLLELYKKNSKKYEDSLNMLNKVESGVYYAKNVFDVFKPYFKLF